MAITQSAESKKGLAQINKEIDGLSYVELGGIYIVVAQGAPATGADSELKIAPQGSLYISTDLAKVYVKSSAGGATTNSTWVDLTATE